MGQEQEPARDSEALVEALVEVLEQEPVPEALVEMLELEPVPDWV